MKPVPFIEVLELLEVRGWKLHRIDGNYRIFTRRDDELPIMLEVVRKHVTMRDYQYVMSIAGPPQPKKNE